MKRYFFILLLILNCFLFPNEFSFAFRNLGVPVKEAAVWGVFLGPGKTGKKDTIYISLGRYNESLSLLAINPETSEIKQFNGPLPSEMGSWGWTIDHENRIYLGTYYNAHLLRFDPKEETWEDLGQPVGRTESFICALTTSPDGKIWGGTFPSAKLFSYDPKTGEIKDYGRMDEKQFYCYPVAGIDGMIYCAIRFEKTDIIVFDPLKCEKTSLIPPEERRPGWLSIIKGEDENIYTKLPSGKWFRIDRAKDLIEIQESKIPFPKRSLPDGKEFNLIDNKILRVLDPKTKEKKDIPIKYEASGAFIFSVGIGPDDKIYGSSMLPLRLFVYDPKDQSLKNLGKASHASGEVYSMTSYNGKLYLCSYPGARISVYDPKRPLQFGDKDESNPRDLGSLGDGQDRPRTMIASPYGGLYIGTYPDYGLYGGALSVFDIKSKEKRVFRHIIPNQSISSLVYISRFDLIAGGSSVRGGGGTRAIEKEARLFLWDPKEEKKIFEIIPVNGAKTIISLTATKEGLVYGITDQEKVFVFDPEKKEIKKVFDLGLKTPLETSLQHGEDGLIYGLTENEIFMIEPKKDRIKSLGQSPVPITAGMAILGRKLYFGSKANLYEFEIPNQMIETKD